MHWTDTHCHLYLPEFENDRSAVVSLALAQGVHRIILPNIDSNSIGSMLRLEEAYPGQCFAAMGLHPCSVKENFEEELRLVEEWLHRRPFVAIGEMGTDRYWDTSFWEQQVEAFKIQANWAKKMGLPLIIHCRESMDETIDLLEQLQDGSLQGVFHCFNGSVEQAARIEALGFYVGLGGVTTFKKAGMERVVPQLNPARILLETDAPYLSPVPYRGKRNEPAYIPLIAQRVAELLGCSLEQLSAQTEENVQRLFFDQKS
ncbi:TatD DNase family protein [Thermonema lapsum]|uniref:TatD DNase family protein n=1 Tax=Thermonema lapsum TaxID=28195 RepID=A0A846MQD1_9BACT|nr:TatD family hydrolase [Thermonema lapsum]NIK73848.1 TatD DNase family protein [Thermonema lapsum]